ncbi:MAG TPA: thiamine pyrophosphate-binding protein [Polyangiales bacterium]
MSKAAVALKSYEGVRPQPMTRGATLADALVGALHENGIDTYFGVPGGAIEPLFNALARASQQGRARVVATRSEAGAGFAADGYFRACGRMAVCTSTTGPGISNLLTAVINAHADRVPMLVITPQVALAKQGRGALQDSSYDGYDMLQVLSTCTVYSSQITHRDQLPHKLRQALSRAQTAPRGPVHLSIASDVLAGGLPGAADAVLSERPLPFEQGLPQDGFEQLWSALSSARRPLFYVGDDAGPQAERLFDLADVFAGSVITSPAGKRWIPHHLPRHAGVLGFSGHASAQQALRDADLVLAFGATFDELSTNAWAAVPQVRTFSIDTHGSFAYRVPQAQALLVDPAAAIDWMTARLPDRALVHNSHMRMRKTRRERVGTNDGPVHPTDLVRWLGESMPADVVLHADTGNSLSWTTRDLVRTRADTYRVAMGLCSMGWAVSAVLGAALASGRRSVCLAGDGAMLMSSLELSVAVQEQLPVTYVVLNDAGLGMVKHGQRLAGAPSIAHQIGSVRFDRIAEACGAQGFRVECLEDLARIPRRFLESSDHGPCVIDVVIDAEAVPPMMDRVVGLQTGIPK